MTCWVENIEDIDGNKQQLLVINPETEIEKSFLLDKETNYYDKVPKHINFDFITTLSALDKWKQELKN